MTTTFNEPLAIPTMDETPTAPAPSPADEGALSPADEEFLADADSIADELAAEQDAAINQQHDATGFDRIGIPMLSPLTAIKASGIDGGMIARAETAMASGIAKAGLETKDFLFGEPTHDDKSDLRKRVEAEAAWVDRQGAGYAITSDISQFAAGMLGAGKLTAPLKLAGKAKVALEIGKAAGAGAVVFDPQEERLSNLVQAYPSLQNPVTAYLASDLDDTSAEGRFKSALESIGLDIAIGTALSGGLKLYKAMKSGNSEAVAKTIMEVEAPKAANMPPVLKTDVELTSPKASPETTLGAGEGDAIISPELRAGDSPSGPSVASGEVPKVDAPPTSKPVADDAAMKDLMARDFTLPEGLPASSPLKAANIPSEGPALAELLDKLAANAIKSVDASTPISPILDVQLQAQVSKLASAFGSEPYEVAMLLVDAGLDGRVMASRLEAAKQLSHSLAKDVSQLATQIKYGMKEDNQAALIELRRQMGLLTETRRAVREMASGSGRALRRMRGDFAVTDAQLKAWEQADPNALVEALYHAGGDLEKLRAATTPGFWKRFKTGADHLLVNGPLWWWPTHVYNGVSNVMMLGTRPLEALIGSAFIGGPGKAVAKQALREYRYMTAATMDGLHASVDAFIKGDSKLSPHESYFTQDAMLNRAVPLERGALKQVETHMDALENFLTTAHAATGLPTRVLGMQDEFFKTIRYRAVVQSNAAARADSLGLKGEDAAQFIKAQLAKAFDDTGRALDTDAMMEAQRATFTQPLLEGTLGHKTQSFINGLPLGRALIPFIRTPVNAFRHSWKLTPGLNLLQTEYRKSLTSGDPATRARAWGQMAIGSSVMAISGMLAINGRITGGGPRDPDQRSLLMSQGWRPYSLVILGEDGAKRFIPLSRLDPASLPLGLAADIVDVLQYPDKMADGEGLASAAMLAIAHNVSDKTFLLSVNSALKAAMEPDKHLARFAGNVLEQGLPFSSLVRGLNTTFHDPYAREARTLVDNALDRMPGYSKSLPPRYNPLGEPTVVSNGLWTDTRFDAVDDELGRLTTETGHGFGALSPSRQGVDLRDFDLEDGENAYARVARYSAKPSDKGPSLREQLLKAINSKSYEAAVDGKPAIIGTKMNILAGIVSRNREAAYKRVLAESPLLRAAITKQRHDTALAIRAKAQRKGQEQEEAQRTPLQDALHLLTGQ